MSPPLRSCLAVILIVWSLANAQATSVPVTTYSTADGLPHYAVNRIVRDSRGFLWLCTREGLARFDGYGFTTYNRSDGLPSATVTDIVELPDGTFWIGTLEGLVRFKPDAPPASRFTTVAAPGDSRTAAVTRVVRDPAGGVWVATRNGLYRVPADEGAPLELVDLGVADERDATVIHSLLADRSGTLWVATGAGLFLRAADGTVRSRRFEDGLPVATVHSIVEDGRGLVWAGTGDGLWWLGQEDGRPIVRQVFTAREGLPHTWVFAVMETSDGTLWVGTLGGIATVDVDTERSTARFTAVEGRPERISQVAALGEDSAGNLWVGTGNAGAMRLPRRGFSRFGEALGLSDARALAAGAAGEVALLAMRGTDWVIVCSDGQRVTPVQPSGELGPLSWAWDQALLRDSFGDWWIGTSKGVFRFEGVRRCEDLRGRRPAAHFDSRQGLAADIVIRLFEDTRGDLWIATVGHGVRSNGLSRWERGTGTFHHYSTGDGLPSLERYYPSAFTEDYHGSVWIGFSGDAGIVRYRAGRFERFARQEGIPAGQIRSIARAAGGQLWFGSFRGGLLRLDDAAADQPVFRLYTTADGLSSNEIHALVEDDAGRIYVRSASGVDRLDPASGLVRHYSEADGVPPAESQSALRDQRGTLWFAHSGGVSLYVPTDDSGGQPPRVYLTAISVAGEPHPVSAVGTQDVPALSLPAHRNSLQVAFVALGTRPGDYVYRYRLDGAGAGWSPYSETRTLNFANLAPARYRLLVEARDSNGRTSEEPAVLAFTIVPPLWRQPWMAGVALVLAAAAAYGLHRARVNRLVEIARIRERIAADLHDDLGANLTKIAVLGEVARQQTRAEDATLTSIAGIARESIGNMSDIVWAIDPAHDTLEDLVRKMRQHATETFAAGDVELAFAAPAVLDRVRIDTESRYDLFLVFKEAINNAARHARATRVDATLSIERGALRLVVSDDGIGFDPGRPGDGRGRSNIRRRAERIGARLDVTSAPGRGTRVELSLPLGAT